MAKLRLTQIDSLIENNEIEETELKEFLKEGYSEAEISAYFLEKLKLSKEEVVEDEEEETNNERTEFEY